MKRFLLGVALGAATSAALAGAQLERTTGSAESGLVPIITLRFTRRLELWIERSQ